MSLHELSETLPINESSSLYQRYSYGERLSNCFLAICERHPLEDPHKITRRVFKAGSAVISAIAKIPFIPVSFELGKVLGPISIVGNSTGYFILEYWAAAGTTDDLFGPRTKAEIELFEEEKSGKGKICRKIIIISTASLIALFSQLPTSLAGMEYNPQQYKIAAGLVLLIAGSLIPIRSLQLSIEQIRLAAKKTTESEIAKIKTRMVSLIRNSHGAFIQENRSAKRLFIEECNTARRFSGPAGEKTNQYALTLISRDIPTISDTKKCISATFNYTGLAIGSALAGIFEYALGEYTFSLTKEEIWDNDIAGGAFAALAVGSTAYLFGTSIIRTTQRIFNLFGNLTTGKEVRNLSWQLRPKLSFILSAIGLLIDLCALGPTYVIWGDFYDQNEVEHQLFQKTTTASLFLILFTSTLDIIDEIVVSSIAYGTEEEQEILKINTEFQKLATLIEKSSSREFIGYLTHLDEASQHELLERINVSSNQLASFAGE